MTEERLQALLAGLVSRGRFTPDEAAAVLDAFRAGDLDGMEWPDAPGPVGRLTPDEILAALRTLLSRL